MANYLNTLSKVGDILRSFVTSQRGPFRLLVYSKKTTLQYNNTESVTENVLNF